MYLLPVGICLRYIRTHGFGKNRAKYLSEAQMKLAQKLVCIQQVDFIYIEQAIEVSRKISSQKNSKTNCEIKVNERICVLTLENLDKYVCDTQRVKTNRHVVCGQQAHDSVTKFV